MQVTVGENGVIESLLVDQEELILPWGVECGDSFGFYSMSEGGLRVQTSSLVKKKTENSITTVKNVSLTEAKLSIETKDTWEEDCIHRTVQAKALKDSQLMDFVLRFRFKKGSLPLAKIASKKISHKNSNLYYQYPSKQVELSGSTYRIKIKIIEGVETRNFKQVMYVRDLKDEWIVHCRMLPTVYSKEVIKLNVSWYNKSLPQFLSDVLLKSGFIRKWLWYRGEQRKCSRWNVFCRLLKPTAYPLAELPRGKKLSFSVFTTISRAQV